MAAEYELYYDGLSQPCRSVMLLLKLVNAPHKIHRVSVLDGEQKKPEFLKLNPFHKIPLLVHGDFILTESPAMSRYILNTNEGADNWYPADPKKRARVDEYLSYQHTTVRRAGIGVLLNFDILQRTTGQPASEEKKEEAMKNVHETLEGFEGYFLKNRAFIAGEEVSIADIFAISEILEVDMSRRDYLSAHPKTAAWIESTKTALQPHFDEVFKELDDFVATL